MDRMIINIKIKDGWPLGENVYIGVVTPFEVKHPFEYSLVKPGQTVMSSLIPKYIVDLKSMKYLAVASMAAQQRLTGGRRKRDAEYVKVYPPVSSRQKPIIPAWGTMYNRRPAISSPWTKDTQSDAVNTAELSDLDIQRETNRANLILVQRMGELIQVEKDKVVSEIRKSAVEMEMMIAEKEKHQMDTQKLEIEKEMIEAKLLSGTAKSLQH